MLALTSLQMTLLCWQIKHFRELSLLCAFSVALDTMTLLFERIIYLKKCDEINATVFQKRVVV